MSGDIRLRPLRCGTDWSGVAALEARVYGPLGLSEGRAALESRGRVSPDTCFVLHRGARVAGYVLALPYPPFQCPDLEHVEECATEPARSASQSARSVQSVQSGQSVGDAVRHSRNLHLHDLVVAEDLRGRGLARRLLRHLTATARARRYERMSLVAVAGSAPFWAARGFHTERGIAVPDSYGADAVYMSMAMAHDEKADKTDAHTALPR
ncbi:GNAT family N-acetyltransferase [Streptomyces boncukensis]|uniref:GNAT family N-acetyltransferase n=1 Tax=Streptomyces boncukensis TaxID=2711219 RepID=A0A6G4X741_9ACTN|nr:GNAT family N-acetyltransferase [Streptomyces boncukensis]NGO72667.1 GNAT family N-acetyltransferase [Streptomyces boncukensis]